MKQGRQGKRFYLVLVGRLVGNFRKKNCVPLR